MIIIRTPYHIRPVTFISHQAQIKSDSYSRQGQDSHSDRLKGKLVFPYSRTIVSILPAGKLMLSSFSCVSVLMAAGRMCVRHLMLYG